MSKYNRNFYLRQTQRGWLRKQHLIDLKGGCCEQCGYNKCTRSLSFHHRDPKRKEFNLDLRNIGNFNWDRVVREFEKCDLLCMNCHHELHDSETDKAYLTYIMRIAESQMMICLICGHEFNIVSSQVKVGGGKYCSIKCCSMGRRRAERPTKDELQKLIWEMPTTHIAESYGLSDKAIEKWCKSYNIEKPPRGYWTKQKKV